MKAKKEQDRLDFEKYSRKISKQATISDLSSLAKEFLKQLLDVNYEATFNELEDIAGKMHMPRTKKSQLMLICQRFEQLSYQAQQPSKEELEELKGLLQDLIVLFSAKTQRQNHKVGFQEILHNAEKITHKQTKTITKRVDKATEEIKDGIISKINEIKLQREEAKKAKEYFEISRYVNISLNSGLSLPDIRNELAEMGFDNQSIETVLKRFRAQ